jgi:hypothetical protein
MFTSMKRKRKCDHQSRVERIVIGRSFYLTQRLTHAPVSRTVDDHPGANAAEGDATANKHNFERSENLMAILDVEPAWTNLD